MQSTRVQFTKTYERYHRERDIHVYSTALKETTSDSNTNAEGYTKVTAGMSHGKNQNHT